MSLYFSATGNSRYAAQRLAAALNDRAVSITGSDGKTTLRRGERLGIVTPTYAWELPEPVRKFLKNAQFTAEGENYVFSVSTYGTTPGASGAEIRHLLKQKGVRVNALYSIRFPDTWTPMFDLRDAERNARINERAESAIDRVAAQIQAETRGNHMQWPAPYFVRLFSHPSYEAMRRTAHFHVEESCIGCGLCAKNCPEQAIRMQAGKPVWVKEKCAACLGCLHRCPKFAIQYGEKTKHHGQYLHPAVHETIKKK